MILDRLQIVILSLIFGGMGIMLFAIVKTKTILRLLSGREGLREWKILYSLTIFFLAGYSLAAIGVAARRDRDLILLMGAIFFFGAMFVLFSINTYYSTLLVTQEKYRKAKDEAEAALAHLKQAQMQLVHNEKMLGLGNLAAGIAHEINNPVSFIHGNLYHLEDGVRNLLGAMESLVWQPAERDRILHEIDLDFLREDLPQLLRSMRVGTERIRDTVTDLRSFSRLDESHYKQSCLNEDIRGTLRIFAAGLRARHDLPPIALSVDYGTLPTVECNPREINQVVMQLLGNAADAIADCPARAAGDGCIQVRTEPVGDRWVAIAIADNGVGIEPRVGQHMFDPFFTTKPVGRGSGLGLAIARNIVVEKHQGQLDYRLRPEGGTEFTIVLPVQLGIRPPISDAPRSPTVAPCLSSTLEDSRNRAHRKSPAA